MEWNIWNLIIMDVNETNNMSKMQKKPKFIHICCQGIDMLQGHVTM